MTEKNLGMLGLPHRCTSMSDEICSTPTSGFYSAAESDVSNSTEQSNTNTKYDNDQSSKRETFGLPERNYINQNTHKNNNPGKRQVSRIPPPKPLRYNFPKSPRDLSYLRSNSDGYKSSNNTLQITRILHNKKKAASSMNIPSKDSQILV